MRSSAAFTMGLLVAVSLSAARRPASEASAVDARLAALERVAKLEATSPTHLLGRIERLEKASQAADSARLRHTPLGSPVQAGVVTSGVSRARFHPILHRWKPHTGVDIAAAQGTAIRATADGSVASVFAHPVLGLGVDLDHGEGTFTRYGHMQKVLVRPGQLVRRGEVIGLLGGTGRVTGPHVHYEVFLRWHRVDAGLFLPDSMPVAAGPGGAGDY